MDPLTRAALAARDGDDAAFTTFVRLSQVDVRRLCAHLVDQQRADDVAQEVYLRAYRSLPRYRGDASARTWLLRIARNTVADALRAAGRRRRLDGRVAMGRRPADDVVADHAGAVGVEQLLAGLVEDRRAAFVLTQVLGLPYAEAAEVCGVPVGTIRSRVARARDDLLAELTADEATS